PGGGPPRPPAGPPPPTPRRGGGGGPAGARPPRPPPPLLVDRYGSEAPQILALGERDPALREPVAPGLDVTAAEFAFARSHEAALTPDDLLDRRTRIGLVAADRAAALAAATAAFEG
ncbi:glycerol-3-phosphate dehydrogenase C-terminal domain-containing protein, partial [Nocardia farcinica]|uniref:glycerol-3-phosphate dehydrogenase C-terminal domain-containing protein n=1 Tax=Nocardia farcinica TaxID=37329 RepID=UPI002453A6BB